MPKKSPELLTKEEMDALLLSASSNLFYNTLFQLAKNTGRRLGEFYGVEKKTKVGDKVVGKKKVYTTEGNQIEVDKTIPIMKPSGEYEYGLKGRDFIFNDDGTSIMKTWVLKRRSYVQDESQISEPLTKLVKQFMRKYDIGLEDYMFRKKTYRTIQSAVSSYAKKAGIKKEVSFHSFRHYFITHLLKQGWSHDKVAKITGHKSVASIGAYDHVLSKDLKNDLTKALENS